MPFKDVLKRERKNKGLTQAEMAKLTGLTVSAISMYENGNREPNFETLELIADFFNIDMDYLLGKSDIQNKNTISNVVKGIRIPILGRVVAGIPLEAIEDIEGWEEITPRMASGGEFFALRIRGSSMEPKLVEGDVVIVRKQSTIDNGDIAIVLVNGNEATCKQVNRTPTGITLIGFNVAVYAPHFYTNDQIESLPVTIVGKVVESRHSW